MEAKVRTTLRTLPRMVGNEAVNFSRDSFRLQGWLNSTFQPWPKRKSSKWGKKGRNGRAILVDKGRLRRGTRVISADWKMVRIGNDVPYASAHNSGLNLGIIQNVRAHRRKRPLGNLTGSGGRKVASGVSFVKAHTRRITQHLPKRQFVGNSPYLTRNIHRLIASQINKALKS